MERPFPAYRGDQPYIFVSYAHADSRQVYRELTWLRDQGVNVWYDEGISPGASWRDELAQSILDCDVFLLFLSPAAVESNHCVRELNYAEEHGVRVLVVHLQPVVLPPGLELSLSGRQAIEKHAMTTDEYQRKLLAGLASQAAASPADQKPAKRSLLLPIAACVVVLAVVAGVFVLLQNTSQPQPTNAQQVTDALPAVSGPSLAVLPFTDLSREQDQGWFSDGIAEELLNGLANNAGLNVIARTSSFSFRNREVDVREIGRILKATHILEGSVRSAENRIRVSVKLIDTASGTQIWSSQFDGELTDVFAVQDAVSSEILEELQLYLAPVEQDPRPSRQVNPEAFRAYLKGKHHLAQNDIDPAIGYMPEAIALDPAFADPKGVLARLHNLKIFFGQASVEQNFKTISQLIDDALAIDPHQREALGVRASNMFLIDRRYQEGLDEFDRLVRTYPSDPTIVSLYRNLMLVINQPEKAVRLADRMVELDPLSPQAHQYRATLLISLGRFDEAEAGYQLSLELGARPTNIAMVHTLLTDNTALFEARMEDRHQRFGEDNFYRFNAAVRAYLEGDHAAVQAWQDRYENPENLPYTQRAGIAWLAGDPAGFFDQYRKAVESSEFTALLNIHSAFVIGWIAPDVMDDPRYKAIVRDAGLDSESLAQLTVPELPF